MSLGFEGRCCANVRGTRCRVPTETRVRPRVPLTLSLYSFDSLFSTRFQVPDSPCGPLFGFVRRLARPRTPRPLWNYNVPLRTLLAFAAALPEGRALFIILLQNWFLGVCWRSEIRRQEPEDAQ